MSSLNNECLAILDLYWVLSECIHQPWAFFCVEVWPSHGYRYQACECKQLDIVRTLESPMHAQSIYYLPLHIVTIASSVQHQCIKRCMYIFTSKIFTHTIQLQLAEIRFFHYIIALYSFKSGKICIMWTELSQLHWLCELIWQ